MIAELIETALKAEADELLTNRWISGGYEQRLTLDEFRRALAPPPPEKSAAEIDRELAEKFDRVKFRRLSLDEMIER